jgi:hypothetical protein
MRAPGGNRARHNQTDFPLQSVAPRLQLVEAAARSEYRFPWYEGVIAELQIVRFSGGKSGNSFRVEVQR